MRAACYARVSSQVQKDRQTIASQLQALPAFVAAQGWTLAAPAGTYVDDGRTAKAGHLAKRDGLSRLMADAAAGKFDVIVVVDLDRLTRSEDIAERGAVLGAFQRAGVRLALASTGQVLDLASSMGDLFAGLQAFFAAEENRKRRERTVRGKLEAIRRGNKPSGPTPYGYTYDRHAKDSPTRGWGVNEAEADVVRLCFDRVIAGDSCELIARELHYQGVRRRRGNQIHREWVWQLLTHTTARGEWVADKERGLVVHVPPIVDAATWHQAQAALTRWGRRGLKRSKHAYLLEGRATCAVCGERVNIQCRTITAGRMARRRFQQVRQSHYVCRHRLRPPWDGLRCTLPYRDVDRVDARVWAAIVEEVSSPRWLEAALGAGRAERAQDRRKVEDPARAARSTLRRLQAAESAVLAAFRRGHVTESGMEEELRAIARDRRAAERDLAAAQRRAGAAGEEARQRMATLATVATLRARIEDADEADRLALAEALIIGCELDVDEIILAVRAVPCLAQGTGSNPRASQPEEPARILRICA
jgi:DNA invertase Pin-like site-specific DNA recombinase